MPALRTPAVVPHSLLYQCKPPPHVQEGFCRCSDVYSSASPLAAPISSRLNTVCYFSSPRKPVADYHKPVMGYTEHHLGRHDGVPRLPRDMAPLNCKAQLLGKVLKPRLAHQRGGS